MIKRFLADQRPPVVIVCAGRGGDRAGADGGMREDVAGRLQPERQEWQGLLPQHLSMTMNVCQMSSRSGTT